MDFTVSLPAPNTRPAPVQHRIAPADRPRGCSCPSNHFGSSWLICACTDLSCPFLRSTRPYLHHLHPSLRFAMQHLQPMRDAALRGHPLLDPLLQWTIRPASVEARGASSKPLVAIRDATHQPTLPHSQPLLPERPILRR